MNPLTACEEVWPALGLSVGRSCNCGHGCWKLPRLLKLLLLLLAPVAAVSCASNSRQRRPSIDGRTPKAVVRPTLEEEDNNRWRTCPTWWIFKGRSRNFSEAEKRPGFPKCFLLILLLSKNSLLLSLLLWCFFLRPPKYSVRQWWKANEIFAWNEISVTFTNFLLVARPNQLRICNSTYWTTFASTDN